MKIRVISSVVGVLILAAVVVLSLSFPIAWNIAVAVMAAIAVHEILMGTKCVKSNATLALSIVFAGFMQFIALFENVIPIVAFSVFAYILVLFLLCMAGKIGVTEIAFTFMGTLMLSGMFLSLVLIKDTLGFPGVILCVCTAWVTDIFALFSGMLFGKHKLAPVISPKKTVEGSVGGFICCVAICTAAAVIYTSLTDGKITLNYINCAVVILICSIISMIGDLSFSLIKRHFKIKDYGKIMPGHGGVLDRFDSVLFAAPTFLILNFILPIIK